MKKVSNRKAFNFNKENLIEVYSQIDTIKKVH